MEENRTLRLDYDILDLNIIKKILTKRIWVLRFLEIKLSEIKVSKTAKGHHIYMTTDKSLDAPTIVWLQTILGSDFKREAFNWNRIVINKLPLKWNLLFTKKYNQKGELIFEEEPLIEFSQQLSEELNNELLKPKEAESNAS